MIFVTVGHQMPFDRLIRAVDEWAGRTGRSDVVAQVGKTSYQPGHIRAVPFLSPARFHEHIRGADALVAHAGTGTILAALELDKPLLVLPRLAGLGETRTDHQIPTAKHFAEARLILAAYDLRELLTRLDELESFRPARTISRTASPELIERLRGFVFG